MTSPNPQPVYITALGAFFPGPPVGNDAMEDHLGRIHGRPSRARRVVLERNGIRSRHYAIDRHQRSLYRNSEMAAHAVREAVERAGLALDDLDFLAAATTQPDLPVPGFASMVHGELASAPLEVASLHGVCASGVAALQSAALQVRAGGRRAAVACASEFPSRLFKASRYEAQECCAEALSFDSEFLRWMLSDGAGAAVLSPRPAASGPSLRIDWIELRSHAGRSPLCMYAGARTGEGERGPSWLDYPSFEAAASAGALNLRQDVGMLKDVVELGIADLTGLIERGKIEPGALDWVVCHYSSELFRTQIFERLRARGFPLRPERWFSNLTTRGNVGSASTYVLLEELVRCGRLEPGQRILLMVPESGRSLMAFAQLTVEGPAPAESELAGELDRVFREFQRELQEVPLVARLRDGRFTLEDYRALLFHLRQQVVEGAGWITRAASHLGRELLPLRSLVIEHAREEHRDYEMLERDYVSVGGSAQAIRAGQKNPGSEALSAWMFHEASQPDPLGLLGAMFVIEGLGRSLATDFGRAIREQLGLAEEQVSFLLYHGTRDGEHVGKLDGILRSGLIGPEAAAKIVRTARVTARLYLLQLEEIDRC